MSSVEEKTLELKEELFSLNEVKEYLRVKKLFEDSEELQELRRKVANCKDNELKQKLVNEYNSHPLVVNFYASREEVKEILKTIQNILN